MFPPSSHAFCIGLAALSCMMIVSTPPTIAYAQATAKTGQVATKITVADIESADYVSGDLPAGQSALTAKVQVLLDRSGISPGVVDGWRGGMSESALKAFQRRAGLPMDGRMSPVVWQLLQPYAVSPLTMEYTIVEADAEGLVDNIPADYAEKAAMTSQGYTSIAEKLAERFHMDERFLQRLNPGVEFVPGATIKATIPAKPIRGQVTRIIVDKETRRVAAYDSKGNMLADYPATVGSAQTPSPHGTHIVDAVALNPTYTYNPNKNFKQGNNDRVLTIPPGPNGPVGDVWIDLSQPTYGIHGTATPSRLFVNQSNGCVRLTNWDARELSHMVQPGKTVVEFLDPGVTIADVTTGHAPGAAVAATSVASGISASRPRPRPAGSAPADSAPTVAQAATSAPTVAGTDPLSVAIADAVGQNLATPAPLAEPIPAPSVASAPAVITSTLPPRRPARTTAASASVAAPAPAPAASAPAQPNSVTSIQAIGAAILPAASIARDGANR